MKPALIIINLLFGLSMTVCLCYTAIQFNNINQLPYGLSDETYIIDVSIPHSSYVFESSVAEVHKNILDIVYQNELTLIHESLDLQGLSVIGFFDLVSNDDYIPIYANENSYLYERYKNTVFEYKNDRIFKIVDTYDSFSIFEGRHQYIYSFADFSYSDGLHGTFYIECNDEETVLKILNSLNQYYDCQLFINNHVGLIDTLKTAFYSDFHYRMVLLGQILTLLNLILIYANHHTNRILHYSIHYIFGGTPSKQINSLLKNNLYRIITGNILGILFFYLIFYKNRVEYIPNHLVIPLVVLLSIFLSTLMYVLSYLITIYRKVVLNENLL